MKPIAALLAGALVFAVFAFALAGCGDDDDSDDGATTETMTAEDTDGGTEAGGTINGTVGPGFDISISPTGPFEPGSYELTVEDLSSAHNFHLTGPGVDVSTSVGDEGTETFTIDLEPGTYEFVCDPHASSMNGSFEVS
jgi:Copper binding proteins, plastocyanin/azurin family